MVNDHDNNIIGFSTHSNLTVLCDSNTIYIDGTFKSCPKYFLQIFTIHALYTVDQCIIVGLTFSPKYIFIDFEKSIHNAAQQVAIFILAKVGGEKYNALA
ncbi:FLYWCH-type domain-containing protein [Aphis craccivora]|uniref:FLYWCH-type domain-containing protein n=1 Tax=Aphis craccivora TaxID=307492 RepID=A0A6G0VQM2_APHCR|nr:FLYWCH-type domain-containing protein [Aphis craccivora]